MVIVLFAAVAVPLVTGAALMAGDRLGRPVAHTTAWLCAILASLICLGAALAATFTGTEVNMPWVPQLGMRLHLVLDGISAPLVILSALVSLLAVAISGKQRPNGTPGLFYGCILTVLGGAVAAFAVRDVIAFFIAFEVVLIPMWVLIDRYADPVSEHRRAGWMFVLYTVFGSMFMLIGLLVLAGTSGTTDIGALADGAARSLPFGARMTAAVLLTIGLAVKVPLFPLHSWLPRAHTAAPTAGSMLLAAVLLKIGTYGFVRLVVLPMPDAWRRIAPVIAVLAVIGIIWCGLVCLVERDLKRLIAWSSVAHMGFVMLALAAGQQIGLQAALFGNIAHGVISALLFAVVGALKWRRGPVPVDEKVVGLRTSDPRLGFALVVGLAAALGLPGLAGFWGEILAVFSAWGATHRPEMLFRVVTVLAVLGSVIAAAYCLRVLRTIWAGEADGPAYESGTEPDDDADAGSTKAGVGVPDAVASDARVTGVEWAAVAVLVVATLALGVYPTALMNAPADELAHALGGLK